MGNFGTFSLSKINLVFQLEKNMFINYGNVYVSW